jgi:hypothetical protein
MYNDMTYWNIIVNMKPDIRLHSYINDTLHIDFSNVFETLWKIP